MDVFDDVDLDRAFAGLMQQIHRQKCPACTAADDGYPFTFSTGCRSGQNEVVRLMRHNLIVESNFGSRGMAVPVGELFG